MQLPTHSRPKIFFVSQKTGQISSANCISPEVEELSHDLPDVLVLLEAAVLVEQDHRRGCEGCLQLEELMQALLRGLSHLILRTKTIKVNNSGDPNSKHSNTAIIRNLNFL